MTKYQLDSIMHQISADYQMGEEDYLILAIHVLKDNPNLAKWNPRIEDAIHSLERSLKVLQS